MKLYGVSIIVEREVSERTEEVSLGELSPPVTYITMESVLACTRTFALSHGDAERRAVASAKEAWPRDKGWGEPRILVAELPISEELAMHIFRKGAGPE